ncbi:MAG TPA: response regulator transcription factor [Lacipirellulaceae bacterium]|nr:response regulator transcription factor [Lacipirellulaceae bacterium]
MSTGRGKFFVAVIDAKDLRRASIVSLLEPWADAQNLRLASFTPDQAVESLSADKKLRMLIVNTGGESVAENLSKLKGLHALASSAPLVIISDCDDSTEVAAAFDANAQGFLTSGIPSALAFQALTFILNGGSYYPPSAMHQLQAVRSDEPDKPRGSSSNESDSGKDPSETNGNGSGSACKRNGLDLVLQNLTARQREVLEHLRLGASNKLIARRLGTTEGTVKVHIRQMMRKCHAANRTQLAIGGFFSADNISTIRNLLPATRSTSKTGGSFFRAG